MRPSTDKDTICALATAHGLGAISVIRISGLKAAEITRTIAAFLPPNLESHKIYYGVLKSADRSLDEVLVSYFGSGRSFTGEATFEISCHGSETVVNEILRALVEAGARPAERGEFTYRAFMNGRMDLVQAESVLAMIESRSQRASGLALRQLQGELSRRLRGMVEQLTWILAHLEANIDFASEDIEIASVDLLHGKASALLTEVESLLSTYRSGRMIQNGFQVMLAGRPNAGKSSLLNALAGSERAIVTPVAGTTRDFVEAEMQIGGVRVTLVDSAGLRVTDDPVEKIGVGRALEKLSEVDLVLYVVDSAEGVTAEDRMFFANVPWDKAVVIGNKSDIKKFDWGDDFGPATETRPGTGSQSDRGMDDDAAASNTGPRPSVGSNSVGSLDADAPITSPRTSVRSARIINTSAKTGVGLAEIKNLLAAETRNELSEDSTVISNARHYRGLEVVRESLKTALPMLSANGSADLIALELQSGLQSLYEILGLTYDDQVMDRVFAEFCLGK